MIVCHHSCVFRLLLNGSFIFSPFPGNLCNFDKCSLIFCIHYLTSHSKFILYNLLLCPSCFNLLLAVQKLLPMFHLFHVVSRFLLPSVSFIFIYCSFLYHFLFPFLFPLFLMHVLVLIMFFHFFWYLHFFHLVSRFSFSLLFVMYVS